VHADTNNNLTLYPNMLFDPEGDLVLTNRPLTFDMSSYLSQHINAVTLAATSTGIVISYTPDSKDRPLRIGTFFQVSPTRAITSFHVVGEGRSVRTSVWVSKSCSITHWQSLFLNAKTRQKFFRRVSIVKEFEEERQKLLQSYGDIPEKGSGLIPRTGIDIAVLEMPPDFRDDKYLVPIPKSKVRGVKNVAIVAYAQRDPREENSRGALYSSTAGLPLYDHEARFINFGAKSLSIGLVSGSSDSYITTEVSLGEGCAGSPVMPISLTKYFWGVQCCAFYDAEPAGGIPRSRNYNVAVSFFHPAVQSLYERFVLPTLPEGEQAEIKTSCYH
jgi:hypothetical protein